MKPMAHRRGQAYALEGIIGAVIVVSALVLGLQAVDIAPWTGDSERQNDLTRVGVADVLDSAQDTDALRTAAVCLDSDGAVHPNVGIPSAPATAFGEILANTLDDSYQYRVSIDYPTADGFESVPVGPQPSLPNQPTVTVSRYVALSDSTPVFEGRECNPRGETLGDLDEDDIYLQETSDGSDLYTVVRVRVVAW